MQVFDADCCYVTDREKVALLDQLTSATSKVSIDDIATIRNKINHFSKFYAIVEK